MAGRTIKLALVAVAMGVLSSGTALAADNAYEDLYVQYHRAKRVAELCRNLTFDQTQAAKFGRLIDAKTNHQIGGGRSLSLLYKAKGEARDLVSKYGCAGADAQAMLQIYDTELAVALSQ